MPTKTLYCSFCFKSQHEVKKLISGPGCIFICAECVDLCNEVISGHLPSSKSGSLEELPTERLLERLGPIEETVQGKGNNSNKSLMFFGRARSVGRRLVRRWASRANPHGSGSPEGRLPGNQNRAEFRSEPNWMGTVPGNPVP